VFTYQDGKILEFETRGRYSNGESGLGIEIGNIFYGTDGYLEIDGGTWKAYRQREKEPFAQSKKVETKKADSNFLAAPGGAEHYANFLDGIRNGNNALTCDIREGHYSTVLPLLANISYRLGRSLKFMGDYEKFANDPEADVLLSRPNRSPYHIPIEV
jgi:hypothetical protein